MFLNFFSNCVNHPFVCIIKSSKFSSYWNLKRKQRRYSYLQSLLPVLAESAQVVPAIKVIFDRDWKTSYSKILINCANKKKIEIETICNDNYSDFINSIDELLSVQLEVQELQNQINKLNTSMQDNGKSLKSKISKLLLLKQTRRNMDITINKLNRLKYILQLVEKINDMIAKKKYISALKNITQLTSHHLIQLQEYSITKKIWNSIPTLMDQIKKRVETNFKEWIHNINKESLFLGKLAFEQTKKYIETIELQNNDDNNLNPDDLQSAAQQMQLQQKFGLFLTFDGNNDNINKKQQIAMLKGNNITKVNSTNLDASITNNNNTLFEKIENLDFNAVYQCIHINETLGSIDEFVNQYSELRRRRRFSILNKQSLINNKNNKLNNSYFYSLCGFYVIEHAISSRYQQLSSQEEIQTFWDQSCKILISRIKNELISSCKLPTELIDIKNSVFILSKSIANYDFKINFITSFLEELRLEFENRLIILLEKNIYKILLKDKFKPFIIQNIDDYECIAAYNLNVNVNSNNNNNNNNNNSSSSDNSSDTDPDTYYSPSDFPMRVPFSVSVPMICGYLDDFVQYYNDYAQYLSDMSPNIRAAVQNAIKNVVCKQLKLIILNSRNIGNNIAINNDNNQSSGSSKNTISSGIIRSLTMSELAQLAVNTMYFEKSCTFFEKELAETADDQQLNNQFFDDNKQQINKQQIPKMHDARNSLKSVMSECSSLFVERLTIRVELILNQYIPRINWMADKTNNNLHEWVYKLLEFLDLTLKNVKYLPTAEYRESACFLAMSRTNTFVMNVLTSVDYIKKFNILSLYNLNLDIIRLETYSQQTLIPGLYETFKLIRQTLNLLLSGKNIIEYLNESTRINKYPAVQPYQLKNILIKYKTLGLLNKNRLPKHVKNLDKNTRDRMLKHLKDLD